MECSRSVLLKCSCTHQSLRSESVGQGGASKCIPDMLSDDASDPEQSSHFGLYVRTQLWLGSITEIQREMEKPGTGALTPS